MDILRAVGRFAVAIGAPILFVAAVVALYVNRMFSWGLIKPEAVALAVAATFAILAGLILMTGKPKAASGLGIAAVVIMSLAFISLKFPGTKRLGNAHIREVDYANSRSADALAVPKIVPGKLPYFINDREPFYWWHPSDSPPVFYDRPGTHPTSGADLWAVDSQEIAQMILRIQNTACPLPKQADLPLLTALPLPVPSPVLTDPAAELISEPQIVTAQPQEVQRIRPKPYEPPPPEDQR